MQTKHVKIEQLDQNFKAHIPTSGDGIVWYDVKREPFRLSGFPWFTEDRVYRRLPLRTYSLMEEVNPKLNELCEHTSGGQVSFCTNATKVAIKTKIGMPIAMGHMAVTGQSSFDCYVSNQEGKLRFINSAIISPQTTAFEYTLYGDYAPFERQIVINFPLYGTVESLEIGLDSQATLSVPPKFRIEKPIIFYGTSITQGGCASRPGMSYTNKLSRMLDAHCISLGFSGNGLGEPEMAHLITEIEEPSCIVLDYEPNAGRNGKLEVTLENFIRILRSKHREVPILVISHIPHLRDGIDNPFSKEHCRLRDFQSDTVRRLTGEGVVNLHFVDGSTLLGEDFEECTVDNLHPTDLGFYRMSENLYPVLKNLIG